MPSSNANANTDLALLSDKELARILSRPGTGEDLAAQVAAETDRRATATERRRRDDRVLRQDEEASRREADAAELEAAAAPSSRTVWRLIRAVRAEHRLLHQKLCDFNARLAAMLAPADGAIVAAEFAIIEKMKVEQEASRREAEAEATGLEVATLRELQLQTAALRQEADAAYLRRVALLQAMTDPDDGMQRRIVVRTRRRDPSLGEGLAVPSYAPFRK